MSPLTYFQALVLGLVQGVTEFLPISSSAHLAISQALFGLQGDSEAMLLFDVAVHLGTIVSVVTVFAGTFRDYLRRLLAECRGDYRAKRVALRITLLGVVAGVPTAVIGLAFKDDFEKAFDSMPDVALGLAITGGLLFITGRLSRPRRGWRRFDWWRAALVGVAQGCSIQPGISRSGSTICTAMWLGLKRPWAAQFSFFLAVPAILGAATVKLVEAWHYPAETWNDFAWGPTLFGAAVAGVSGVYALRAVVALVVRDKLQHFCYYCWIAAAVVYFGFD